MSEAAEGPVAAVARQVARLRTRRGLTAKELGEQMSEKGLRWDRFTVANLESGKRQNVTVTELLALAAVLNVAPVHLLVPTDKPDDWPYLVTPKRSLPVMEVRSWIRGTFPLPGAPFRDYYSEVPESEFGVVHPAPFGRPRSAPDAPARGTRGLEELARLRLAAEVLSAIGPRGTASEALARQRQEDPEIFEEHVTRYLEKQGKLPLPDHFGKAGDGGE